MKLKLAALALVAIGSAAIAQSDHYVQGYERSNGTYVQGHEQTNPNSTRNDNYSTSGNVNPYTGQEGTKPRDGETSFGSPSSHRSGYNGNNGF